MHTTVSWKSEEVNTLSNFPYLSFFFNIVLIFNPSSIVALQPFLCPRANSTSYHMNQSCTGIVTPSVLKWFWFSYLKLGLFDENNMGEEIAKHPLFQLGGIGSIHPMLRLCYPTADAPYHLRQTEGKPMPPEIFVVEGSGDPLRDDARDLIDTLEQQCD